jgi:hypothetical protein
VPSSQQDEAASSIEAYWPPAASPDAPAESPRRGVGVATGRLGQPAIKETAAAPNPSVQPAPLVEKMSRFKRLRAAVRGLKGTPEPPPAMDNDAVDADGAKGSLQLSPLVVAAPEGLTPALAPPRRRSLGRWLFGRCCGGSTAVMCE